MIKRSLRDDIAMAIIPTLIKLVAGNAFVIRDDHHGKTHQQIVADEAYAIADACMVVREQQNGA